MNNLKMLAYALIAIGLINWDYQRGNPNVIVNSLLIILPGAILLSLTLTKFGRGWLANKFSIYLWSVIGIAAILFAFINK